MSVLPAFLSVRSASEQHRIIPRSGPTSAFLGGFLEARHHTDYKDLVGLQSALHNFYLMLPQLHKYYDYRESKEAISTLQASSAHRYKS